MTPNPPLTLQLTPVVGRPRSLREQLTTFHLVFIAFDPSIRSNRAFTDTAKRILSNFEQADCRVATVFTSDEATAREAFGDLVDQFQCFLDPNSEFVTSCGITRLPAFVHLAQDGSVAGASSGWKPAEWQKIADDLAKTMSWNAPVIPLPSDPPAYSGSPSVATT